MTLDLDYIRHLRERHEEWFDRCLANALLEAAGFEKPSLEGDILWHVCPLRRKLIPLRGEDGAFRALHVWPRLDFALERLLGQPTGIAVEAFKDILGLTPRKTEALFKRLRKAHERAFSKDRLNELSDRLLHRAASLLLNILQASGKMHTVRQGAACLA